MCVPVDSTFLSFAEQDFFSPLNVENSIISRIKHIGDDIDPLLPNAPEIMRGRVKEITSVVLDRYKKLLSQLSCQSLNEAASTSSAQSAFQEPLEQSSILMSVSLKGAFLFNKVMDVFPSTIEELEYFFRLSRVLQDFMHQIAIAGEAGIQEKDNPTPKEVGGLRAFCDYEKRNGLVVTDCEDFLEQEKARLPASDSRNHSLEPLNLNYFVTAIETVQELRSSFESQEKTLDLGQKEVSVDQVFLHALERVERFLGEPTTSQKLQLLAPFSKNISRNLLPRENSSPIPFSKEVIEKYSKDDLCRALFFYAVVAVIPDVCQQIRPLLLSSVRINCGHSMGRLHSEDICDKVSTLFSNVHPSSELGERFKEFYLQSIHRHFPPKRSKAVGAEVQVEGQRREPPTKKTKLN